MKYLPLAILLAAAACQPSPTSSGTDDGVLEAQARRARSVAAVDALGMPTNPDMPLSLASADEAERSREDVANRAIAVMFSAIKGERGHDETLTADIERFGERAAFSERESAFIDDPTPELQTRIDFSWRFECLHVLLWSLGYVDELHPPGQTADLGTEVTLVLDAGVALGEEMTVRPTSEMLDAADLYAHLLWSGRALRASGAQFPETFNYSVVYERLRALRWLTGDSGQSWDEVTLETPG